MRKINGERPYNLPERKIFESAVEDYHAKYYESLAREMGVPLSYALVKRRYPTSERGRAIRLAKEQVAMYRENKTKTVRKEIATFTWSPHGNMRSNPTKKDQK